MTKYYTGVGSRLTPNKILDVIEELAASLALEQWVLRSGGANGADAAFEEGCDSVGGLKEIFLPWDEFNENKSTLYPPNAEAFNLAKVYHPSFASLSVPARLLMARNSHQVLGQDLKTPSSFLVCWTEDGCSSFRERKRTTGGTGQAISIASTNHIPVFNLSNKGCIEHLFKFLDGDI